MRLISIQDALRRVFERQSNLPGLEFHASGHCVHTGKISPGCYACFSPDTLRFNIPLGSRCNCSCDYCYRLPGEPFLSSPKCEERLKQKASILKTVHAPGLQYARAIVSFTSGRGEPLLYADLLEDCMRLFRDIENGMTTRPWYYLYTNGTLADRDMLLRLKDIGFHEIRVHLGASNFAEGVYRNLREAVKILDTVTVETPAWPPHRTKLFEMLPVLDDLGVKHLNLGQVEITAGNRDRISEVLPEAEVFLYHSIHLDNHGLVYDIVEESLRKGYRFSVLDCSAFVKSIQRSQGKSILHESVEDLCVDVPVQQNIQSKDKEYKNRKMGNQLINH
jgi:pyruvate formate-lyase activating enzyme-like uncharacterized protein